MIRIGMVSGGESSWAAMKRDAERRGVDGLRLLFCDTKSEDEETYQFLHDSAANIGAPLIVIADGRSLWEFFRDRGMIANSRADLCSAELKRKVADQWLRSNCDPGTTTVLLGYTCEEMHRFRRAKGRYAANGWHAAAPLCEAPYLSAREVKDWARREGLPEQKLYRLGFPHANCGGFCVKAGHAHFRHLLRVMPEVYAYHETQEELTRQHLGKDVSVLRDRRGGKTTPLTLRQFRERIEAGGQCDLFDWGGCGCFSSDEETDHGL